jgi:hypothetical protein
MPDKEEIFILLNLGLVTNGKVGRLINIQTPSVSGLHPNGRHQIVIAKLQAAGAMERTQQRQQAARLRAVPEDLLVLMPNFW